MTEPVTTARHEIGVLVRDADPVVRAIGVALTRTVHDDLDAGERAWVQRIEALRDELTASTETIDTALANTRGVVKPLPLADVARQRSKKGLWALVLHLLVRELRPPQILELGTCLGISGSYLAAGAASNGRGHLMTLEGAPALAARSAEHFARLDLRDVEVVAGLFRNTLPRVLERAGPFHVAFVDGHHDEHATIEYFELVRPRLAPDAVVVFDDIRWSDGMERAWEVLCAHPAVRVAVDLDRIGICVVGDAVAPQVLALPRLTTMASTARRVR